MRLITILAHTGVVTGLAGLFFGGLAWAYDSPFGVGMSLGSLGLLAASTGLGWYYGFSPMWRPHGWEDAVATPDPPAENQPQRYVVSTQQYPPYVVRQQKKRGGMRFGTAVYALPDDGQEVAEEAPALYGLQWRESEEAREGHEWVTQVLREGRLSELAGFRPVSEETS